MAAQIAAYESTKEGLVGAPTDPADLRFHYVLSCPCGKTLAGETKDEIVEVSFAHLRTEHPDRADDYEREHILALARRLVRPP